MTLRDSERYSRLIPILHPDRRASSTPRPRRRLQRRPCVQTGKRTPRAKNHHPLLFGRHRTLGKDLATRSNDPKNQQNRSKIPKKIRTLLKTGEPNWDWRGLSLYIGGGRRCKSPREWWIWIKRERRRYRPSKLDRRNKMGWGYEVWNEIGLWILGWTMKFGLGPGEK